MPSFFKALMPTRHKAGDSGTFSTVKDVDALERYSISTTETLEERVQVATGSKFVEHVNLPAPVYGTDADVVKSMIFQRDHVPARVPKRLHFTQRSPFSRKRGSPHGFRQLAGLVHTRPCTSDGETRIHLLQDADSCERVNVQTAHIAGCSPARASRKSIFGFKYTPHWMSLDDSDMPLRSNFKHKDELGKRLMKVCRFRQWHTLTGSGADRVDIIGSGGCNARAPTRYCKPNHHTCLSIPEPYCMPNHHTCLSGPEPVRCNSW